MKPTDEQIKAEIKALEELRPRVRHHTIFGGDNRAAIDVQIRVLKGEIDDFDIDDLFDEEELTEHERDSAWEAANWMEGEGETDTLSENWQPLAKGNL